MLLLNRFRKNHRLSGEGGYVLITVLMAFLVISLVGAAVLHTTVDSHVTLRTNEDELQAALMAETGLNVLQARVNNSIATLNANRAALIPSTLDSQVRAGLSIAPRTWTLPKDYSYQIVSLQTTATPVNGNGPYTILVNMEASGRSGTFTKSITRQMSVTTTATMFLYGSLSDSDMVLNGATYIEGNVFVGGKLIAYNKGFIPTYWQPSSYPTIKGSVLANGGYFLKKTNTADMSNSALNNSSYYTKYNNPSTAYSPTNFARNYLGGALVSNAQPVYSALRIADKVTEKSNPLTNPAKTYNASLTVQPTDNITLNGDVAINGSLTIKPGGKLTIRNGSLRIDGALVIGTTTATATSSLLLDADRYVYVGGNNSTSTYKAAIYNAKLSSGIYVNGNLNMQKTFGNASVYANGTGLLEFLANDAQRTTDTLLILCEKDLTVQQNNEYMDTPKVLNAYFYTNEDLLMYGMWSNLELHGGIYGKTVTLNTVKGRTTRTAPSGYSAWQITSSLFFEKGADNATQNSLDAKKARLSIYYQPDIILNAPAGIPTVDSLQTSIIQTLSTN